MDDSNAPEDMFSLLADSTRLDIIRVLGEEGESLTFTELQARVATDDSGRFNYHLNRIVGAFVRKTEDGTYELSYAGGRVIGAIYSGEFRRNVSFEPFQLDSKCLNCEIPIEATYKDEVVTIQCPNCEKANCRFWFPPHGIQDHSDEQLTNVLDRWLQHRYPLKVHGICDNCTGVIEADIVDEAEFKHPEDPVCIQYECERCPEDALLSLSSFIYMHPEVISQSISKGVDITNVEAWNVRSFLDPTIEVRSKEPWIIDVAFHIGETELLATIDENLSVHVSR